MMNRLINISHRFFQYVIRKAGARLRCALSKTASRKQYLQTPNSWLLLKYHLGVLRPLS